MTTVLIIVCIVFCIGVVLTVVGHLGIGIALDRRWRRRMARHNVWRRRRTHNEMDLTFR